MSKERLNRLLRQAIMSMSGLNLGPQRRRIELNCLTMQIEESHRFINFEEFWIFKISSGKYTPMISQNTCRPPGFPSRVSRQSSCQIRQRPVQKPEDLAGKTIESRNGGICLLGFEGWIQHMLEYGKTEWRRPSISQ